MVVGYCRIDVWYVVVVKSMVKVRDGKRKQEASTMILLRHWSC